MRSAYLFALSLAPVAAMAHPGHGPEVNPAGLAAAVVLFGVVCSVMAALHALQCRRGV